MTKINKFSAEQFFDYTEFPFKDIFKEQEYVWDTIPAILPFIESLFRKGIVQNNYKDSKNVSIGEGTIILPGAYIEGPAVIGKNCVIGHASLLRKGCIIGDNCHIGHAVEVKHSILLNYAVAAHLNYIGDSIVGNNVNIAGGTIVANYRLDKKTVNIKDKDKFINTGLVKFGAIIGDETNIGVNAVINPGTILGKECIVFPLHSVSGVHEYEETIK